MASKRFLEFRSDEASQEGRKGRRDARVIDIFGELGVLERYLLLKIQRYQC